MIIAIKYPKRKFVEANNIIELQNILKDLMIEEFDIKDISAKSFKDIKLNIKTLEMTEKDFKLFDINSVIVPTDIKQCEM